MIDAATLEAALHAAPPPAAARPLGDSGTAEADAATLSDAAVLVPFLMAPEPRIVLTRRADSLRTHKGQVAFPGGRLEGAETALEGALREAEEEIGLARRLARPIGYLDPYVTVTGFRVQPCVAILPEDAILTPDPREVADIFFVPLAFLADRRNHERRSGIWRGRKRHAYAMPYDGFDIWGATAGMIRNLIDLVFGPEETESLRRAPETVRIEMWDRQPS